MIRHINEASVKCVVLLEVGSHSRIERSAHLRVVPVPRFPRVHITKFARNVFAKYALCTY